MKFCLLIYFELEKKEAISSFYLNFILSFFYKYDLKITIKMATSNSCIQIGNRISNKEYFIGYRLPLSTYNIQHSCNALI